MNQPKTEGVQLLVASVLTVVVVYGVGAAFAGNNEILLEVRRCLHDGYALQPHLPIRGEPIIDAVVSQIRLAVPRIDGACWYDKLAAAWHWAHPWVPCAP